MMYTKSNQDDKSITARLGLGVSKKWEAKLRN